MQIPALLVLAYTHMLYAYSPLLQSDVLFVLHDAGESIGLQTVVDHIMNDAIYTTTILCLGEPSTSIYLNYSNAITLQDIGINVTVLDGSSGRGQLLSTDDITALVNSIHANTTVCGMAYAMEAQICAAMENGPVLHSFPLSFYDSFALWTNESIDTTAGMYFVQPKPEPVQIIMTTAEQQEQSMNPSLSGHCNATLTGNPSLESWSAEDDDFTQKMKTREALYGPNNTGVVGVVYAGGYGVGYNESLEIFCSAVNIISASPTDMRFVFSPHPGYPSSYETDIFTDLGCIAYVLVLPEGNELSTSEIIVASNASISQCSTVGGQSVSTGVPHVYAYASDGSTELCVDVFTDAGLIPPAFTDDSLVQTLNVSFREDGFYIDPDTVTSAGVPLNGTLAVTNLIYSTLSTVNFHDDDTNESNSSYFTGVKFVIVAITSGVACVSAIGFFLIYRMRANRNTDRSTLLQSHKYSQ